MSYDKNFPMHKVSMLIFSNLSDIPLDAQYQPHAVKIRCEFIKGLLNKYSLDEYISDVQIYEIWDSIKNRLGLADVNVEDSNYMSMK